MEKSIRDVEQGIREKEEEIREKSGEAAEQIIQTARELAAGTDLCILELADRYVTAPERESTVRKNCGQDGIRAASAIAKKTDRRVAELARHRAHLLWAVAGREEKDSRRATPDTYIHTVEQIVETLEKWVRDEIGEGAETAIEESKSLAESIGDQSILSLAAIYANMAHEEDVVREKHGQSGVEMALELARSTPFTTIVLARKYAVLRETVEERDRRARNSHRP